MELIDKADVVAEIERRKEFWGSKRALAPAPYAEKECKEILSFIDTLEVKEVDLVEEIDYEDYARFFKEHPEYNDGSWGFEETWTFAQYFYTLGLKQFENVNKN